MQDFRLKVFRTVAEKLNFTNAAEALFLTQPAVTLQIKTLEEDLGVKLFDRAGGKVRLTEAGEVLQEYAVRITDLYNEAEIAIGNLMGEERGNLAVGASTTIAQYVLPSLVGEFLSYYSRIDFSIISANTANVVSALDEEKINVGLVEGPVRRKDLKTTKFIEDEIVAIVPANHDLATVGTKQIDISKLTESPLIMRESGSGTRRVAETAFKRSKLKMRDLQIVIELDSTEAIKSAVESNLGIGFVSRWALTKELQLGTLKVINFKNLKMNRQFNFIYPRTPKLSRTAETFLKFALRRRPFLSKR